MKKLGTCINGVNSTKEEWRICDITSEFTGKCQKWYDDNNFTIDVEIFKSYFCNLVSKEVQTHEDSLTRQWSCYLTSVPTGVGKKKEKSVSYSSIEIDNLLQGDGKTKIKFSRTPVNINLNASELLKLLSQLNNLNQQTLLKSSNRLKLINRLNMLQTLLTK